MSMGFAQLAAEQVAPNVSMSERRGCLDCARFARFHIYRATNILRAVTEKMEYGFALFAKVPYHDPKTQRELLCLLDEASFLD